MQEQSTTRAELKWSSVGSGARARLDSSRSTTCLQVDRELESSERICINSDGFIQSGYGSAMGVSVDYSFEINV